MSSAVGIDLAGVENNDTGFCIIDENLKADYCILHTDSEIIDNTTIILAGFKDYLWLLRLKG